MKPTIGKILLALGKTRMFRSIVVELLAKNPGLMDCVDLATEIYNDVKEVTKNE